MDNKTVRNCICQFPNYSMGCQPSQGPGTGWKDLVIIGVHGSGAEALEPGKALGEAPDANPAARGKAAGRGLQKKHVGKLQIET